MAVAVLLPVYGGDSAELFEQALISIENQVDLSESVHVYLGVDGALPGGLEQVIDDHLPLFHKIVRHRLNVGPSENLNSLWREVGDEWLVFRMDADDYAAPSRFCSQIDFMRTHPDIHILGSAIEEHNYETGLVTLRRYPSDPGEMKRAIAFANPLAHPAVCIRPEVLTAFGGYPSVRNQDLALWFKALEHGFRISNLSEPLLRMHVSRSFFERRNSLRRAWPEFLIYLHGIWRLHGLNWRLVYPFARLMFRMLGAGTARVLYRSGLRNRFASQRTPLNAD